MKLNKKYLLTQIYALNTLLCNVEREEYERFIEGVRNREQSGKSNYRNRLGV